MKYIFPLVMILTSCTVSVNMIGTQGKAADVIDTEQTNEPEVSPTLSLPLVG